MTVKLKRELQAFIKRQVREGKYSSASAAVAEAVHRLKIREQKIAWLQKELQVGLDELERGEGSEWDVEEMKSRLRKKYGKA
jgi:antitoxin ParD1/3/4